jgi:hypothetical protein
VARYRQNKKEKEKAKESVIVNSNVTRAASIEETIQPFAVLENTEQSVHQEDVREAPSEMNPVETSVPLSSNRSCLFRMFPAPMRGRGRPPKHSNRRSKSSQASQQKAKSKRGGFPALSNVLHHWSAGAPGGLPAEFTREVGNFPADSRRRPPLLLSAKVPQ